MESIFLVFGNQLVAKKLQRKPSRRGIENMKTSKTFKFSVGFIAFFIAVVVIVLVLKSDSALITHPEGIIASQQLDLMMTNIFLMLIIIIPTYLVLFWVLWLAKKKDAKHDPEHSFGLMGEILQWTLPAIIVTIMAFITWHATHELDPYQPIQSEVKPLHIQVVALDWKWLFIYPEQGIATVNYVQFPAMTPIKLSLSADGSPMNSFWIPQLSGQIYSMTGMITPLHLMADRPGVYSGRAAEINGEGYAYMTFVAKSTSTKDFEDWVDEVKKSTLSLNDTAYEKLLDRSVNHPIELFSSVEGGLFHKIVEKNMMHPTKD